MIVASIQPAESVTLQPPHLASTPLGPPHRITAQPAETDVFASKSGGWLAALDATLACLALSTEEDDDEVVVERPSYLAIGPTRGKKVHLFDTWIEAIGNSLREQGKPSLAWSTELQAREK